MEVAINNSYLREKKKRIKPGQAKIGSALQSESNEDGKLDDEDVCRLVLFDPKGDCDVCSNRNKHRGITAYVCINKRCIIKLKRCDRSDRYFRVYPECFGLHLQ